MIEETAEADVELPEGFALRETRRFGDTQLMFAVFAIETHGTRGALARGFICGRTARHRKCFEGIRTLLMTWITPFDCSTSAMVTLAVRPFESVISKVLPFSVMVSGSPCTLLNVACPPPCLTAESLPWSSGRATRDR